MIKIQNKIKELNDKILKQICNDLPTAFGIVNYTVSNYPILKVLMK